MKIVLIGAGSRSFGRGQVNDILQSEELRDLPVELLLVDEDANALATMLKFAQRVRDHVGSDIVVKSTTEREDALPGADFVITAVERKRMELWEQDYRIPHAYGFKQIMGENGGPGALFHALRTIDIVVPVAQDIERLCPDAWLLNFTNPEARVLHAVSHLTKAKAAGFCHGVFTALDALASYTGVSREQMDVVSAGINHFYAILKCCDVRSGKDLLPEAIEAVANDPNAQPLFRRFAQTFDVFTFPSDDHIGEYFSWATDPHPVKWPFGIEFQNVPVTTVDGGPSLDDWADGTAPLDDTALQCSGEDTVPVIAATVLDRETRFHAVNVLNTDGYIINMPRSAAVEVPATADAAGIHPESVGMLPEPFASFLRTQADITELVTEAYRSRSRKVLLQALLIDPVVDSITQVERMLDDMLETQKDWLPEFS
jgi:alpha-galactosidase